MDIIEQLTVQAEAMEQAIDGNEDALSAWDKFLEGVVAAVDLLAARVKSNLVIAEA